MSISASDIKEMFSLNIALNITISKYFIDSYNSIILIENHGDELFYFRFPRLSTLNSIIWQSTYEIEENLTQVDIDYVNKRIGRVL